MSTAGSHNEQELLLQIAQGNAAAFRIFFDLYKNRLFVFVEQLIHSRADAEEIVQDTFMKGWENASRLTEMDKPGHYIYTIARNKTINRMRKIARDQPPALNVMDHLSGWCREK